MSIIIEKFINLAQSLFAPAMTSEAGPWTTHDSNIALYQSLSQADPSSKRPALPAEIILHILNHPSRWILSQEAEFPDPSDPAAKDKIGRVPSQRAPQTFIRLHPLTRYEAKCIRRVVFEMKGKDQGWSSYASSHGTYAGSWTWYEAVVRNTNSQIPPPPDRSSDPNPPLSNPQQRPMIRTTEDHNPRVRPVTSVQHDAVPSTPEESLRRYELQRNRHAGRHPEFYRVEMDEDSQLVRALQENDVITFDAWAMFGGWECNVHYAKIEVWCVDDLRDGEDGARHQR